MRGASGSLVKLSNPARRQARIDRVRAAPRPGRSAIASCSRALSLAMDTCESRASARPHREMSAGRLPIKARQSWRSQGPCARPEKQSRRRARVRCGRCRRFSRQRVIVTADGRTPEARFRMDATPGDLIDGAPLVVLVNGGLGLGFRDRGGRASRTTVARCSSDAAPTARARCRPSCRSLTAGAVKLTTSRYSRPRATSIHGKGIVPDIVQDGPGPAPCGAAGGQGLTAARRSRRRRARGTRDALKDPRRCRAALRAAGGHALARA